MSGGKEHRVTQIHPRLCSFGGAANTSLCGSGFPAATRHSGRRETTIRNPEKIIFYWIPDLDFVSSGMTFVTVSRLFQQPATLYSLCPMLHALCQKKTGPNWTRLKLSKCPSRLARIFHELLSRDHEDGRATGQPQGVGSEAYLNGTSQGPTPEDARKDGHIRGRSK